jgi:hypothetical protein
MAKLSNLSRACENNFLWPTIADAVDTFLRRRDCEADSYERVWRLIHIWEAAEITLSVAAITKLNQQPEPTGALLRCREFFYGVSWDQVTLSFKASQGASKGSIDQWINILFEVSKMPCNAEGFIGGLCRFLQSESITLEALVRAWGRACDVPPDARSPSAIPVKSAMRHINAFRNRFAHVPFPHDPLDDLAEALENVTEQLFSVEPVPSCHFKDGASSPLTGIYRFGSQDHRGILRIRNEAPVDDRVFFVHPASRVSAEYEPEQWAADPFVYVDSMMRPHMLTRVDDLGIPEYTRYRAEANAVIIYDTANVHDALPQPRPTEYPHGVTEPEDEEEETEGDQGPSTVSVAIDAIRGERFDEAIESFRELTQNRPKYHIGWLRLGHAEREKALRIATASAEEAVTLLEKAAEDLGVAAGHRDREYVAEALYERSKVYFHLAKLNRKRDENFSRSLADAQGACESSTEEYKYRSWREYLHNSPLAGVVRKSQSTDGQEDEGTSAAGP